MHVCTSGILAHVLRQERFKNTTLLTQRAYLFWTFLILTFCFSLSSLTLLIEKQLYALFEFQYTYLPLVAYEHTP